MVLLLEINSSPAIARKLDFPKQQYESIVRTLKTMLSLYSYFMATRGKVKLLSRGSGEDLGK